MLYISEMEQGETRYPVNAPDGKLEVWTRETSWTHINEIPPQIGVVNSVEADYPNFTSQFLKGELEVKDGVIDLDELSELFPDNWNEYNSHNFFEGIESDGRIILGS